MSNDIKKFLLDILNSIQFIEHQIGPPQIFADYKNNEFLKSAVERKIEIIGEALNRIVKITLKLTLPTKRKLLVQGTG